MPATPDRVPLTDRAALLELALIFLRLGTVAFGGPAAHLAMMRTEFVDRRRWLTGEEFLDLVGASNLIPGPGSTEVALFIGMRRAGWVGLVLAGIFFILPAALIVSAFAWAYVRLGHLPQTAGLLAGILYGIKPVIIAVVAQALWALGRAALKTRLLTVIGASALALCFAGIPPLALLVGAGALTGARGWWREGPTRSLKPVLILAGVITLLVIFPLALASLSSPAGRLASSVPLFFVFLKIGSVVFGSGYVLLAFLRADLVTHLHWLTSAQLLDAVAVGQFTPGPVFTTATFIGYILAGPSGAAAATLGIFLPAFAFVALSGPLVPRLRRSPAAGAFLDGVNAASLALMAFVTGQLARAALVDGVTVGLVVVSALLLLRFRVNSVWLVLGGAVVGAVTGGRH